MDNKEFSKELEKRMQKFAVRALRLSTALPNTPEGRVIRNHITLTLVTLVTSNLVATMPCYGILISYYDDKKIS